jgi:hypothetical protein
MLRHMDKELNEPSLERVDLVKLQRKHPRAEIAFDHETHAWGALLRTSDVSLRYVVGPTLPQLAAKLGVEGGESGACESR